MPYKKKRRCNAQIWKQKKRITSRLMEISLKVDDYIYNNKKIADNESEMFIQEVAAYKTLCTNDERCLQVIEKLTRILKGIIAEEQELNGTRNICNEYCTFEKSDQFRGAISPVYSTPDEDRTHFTLIEAEEAIHDAMTKSEKEIIDLCDSDDENLQDDLRKIPTMVVDVEVHRGMSEFSLSPGDDVAIQMTPSADNECSQSILKHLDNIEINEEAIKQNTTVQVTSSNGNHSQSILKNIEINKEQATRNTDNDFTKKIITVANNDIRATVATGAILKPSNNQILTIEPSQNTTSNILQCIDNAISTLHINFNTPPCTKNSIITNNSSTATFIKTVNNNNNNKIHENHNKNTMSSNVSNNLMNTFSPRNCLKSDNRSKHSNNAITTDVNSNKDNNKHINTNKKYQPEVIKISTTSSVNPTHINVNQLVNKDDKTTTTKKKSRKKKTEETHDKKGKDTFKKPPAKRTKNKNVKQSNKKIPIYNNNTESDLSWVENIRFVREINENEYERQLKFKDDFWVNYSAPGLWNDQDFHC